MERFLNLLLVFCFSHLCLACQDNERQALLTFKQSLTDDCNLLSNWRGADCCRWREVGCSKKEGNVIKLSIGRLTDGRIPSGNQIQTLTDPSIYAGNTDLCGSPLPRCPGDEHSRVPTQGADAEDEDGDSDMFELYLGMGIGFAVGWWVICGAFIFKNSWRVACFQYYDDMENNFIVKMDTLRRRPRLSNFRVRDEGRVTNIIH